MELRNNLRILFLLFMAMLWSNLHGQNIPPEILVQMQLHEFEDWLIDQHKNQTLELEQLSRVVCERLKNRDGIPSQTVIEVLRNSNLPSASKISFIDTVLPYLYNDISLTIDLSDIKSSYLNNKDPNKPASILKMNPTLEKETIRLTKVLYSNYLYLGNRYLQSKDTLEAVNYYVKARTFPFYLIENYDDRVFFENIYVQASIGHIYAYQGNYSKLKQLRFVPAAYPGILPTYRKFIENAGGRCSICDEYLKDEPKLQNFEPTPPIQDKN